MFTYALLGQNFGLHQTMEPARNSAYPFTIGCEHHQPKARSAPASAVGILM